MNTVSELHVVFGAGPLGLAVARALVERGKTTRLVCRSGRAAAPAGVEVVAADACQPEEARRAVQGAAVVYQCAQPGYAQWVERFPPLQAGILAAASAANARLVVGDNLYMYGQVNGPIHEDLPYAAATRKGQVRARMAEELLTAHRRGQVSVAIARGSDFFGPYVLGSTLGERVFTPALQGKAASALGNPDLPHTYTFIDDFGRAMVTLGERPEAAGQVWHVPNPETLTQRQIITLIFEEIGRPPRISSMGRFMLRLGGLFIPEARETVEMMYQFEKPFVVDDSKYRRTFAQDATPLRRALSETIAWYRQRQ